MTSTKPPGLQAARRLRNDRRKLSMADSSGLRRRVLGTLHKIPSHPAPPRRPPSEKVPVKEFSMSQCVCIQLFKDGKTLTAYVPNDCLLGFLDEDDQVTVSGLCCDDPSEA